MCIDAIRDITRSASGNACTRQAKSPIESSNDQNRWHSSLLVWCHLNARRLIEFADNRLIASFDHLHMMFAYRIIGSGCRQDVVWVGFQARATVTGHFY